MDRDPGAARVDFVLGDRHGASCHPSVTASVAGLLGDLGYVVRINDPYAGGYTTLHYGQPLGGVHGLQIEINRALYMNESTIERGPGMKTIASRMSAVIDVLGARDPRRLTPRAVAECPRGSAPPASTGLCLHFLKPDCSFYGLVGSDSGPWAGEYLGCLVSAG